MKIKITILTHKIENYLKMKDLNQKIINFSYDENLQVDDFFVSK